MTTLTIQNTPPAGPTQSPPQETPGAAPARGHLGHAIQRVLILGGGFGGLYTARRLEKIFKNHEGVEITLISRENYFLMTPFLFEAGSGVLEPRHAVTPLRRLFKKVRFVEAEVEHIDLESRTVLARHAPTTGGEQPYKLHFDHLVLALGGVTNRSLIPGSDNAIGFKTLGDAIFLRNTLIDLFERADVEEDPDERRRLLMLVIIGGGLVGVELVGELTEFIHTLLKSYPRIPREFVRLFLIEASTRILPEMDEELARFSAEALWKRGVSILTNTQVASIEPRKVHLPAGVTVPGTRGEGDRQSTIEAQTILLAAGIAANPLLAELPLEKARNGRIKVDGFMRVPDHPGIWALGDCAVIPDKNGKPYPPLAQHALREARVLGDNIAAVVHHPAGAAEPPQGLRPFEYQTMGMLAALGHYNGVGSIMNFRIKGFFAWWVWRTYYMLQMPRFERKLRVILDWTVALFFHNDVVKLDLFGLEHPVRRARRDETPIDISRQRSSAQPSQTMQ